MLVFGQTKSYEVHVMFIYLGTIEAAGDRLINCKFWRLNFLKRQRSFDVAANNSETQTHT